MATKALLVTERFLVSLLLIIVVDVISAENSADVLTCDVLRACRQVDGVQSELAAVATKLEQERVSAGLQWFGSSSSRVEVAL